MCGQAAKLCKLKMGIRGEKMRIHGRKLSKSWFVALEAPLVFKGNG